MGLLYRHKQKRMLFCFPGNDMQVAFCFAQVVQVSGHPIAELYQIPPALSRQRNTAFSVAPPLCETVGCGSRL